MNRIRKLAAASAVVPFGLLVLSPVDALAVQSAKALRAAHGEDTPLSLPVDQPSHLSATGAGSGGLVRTFVGLAVVVGVIYGLTWVLRQVKASREERSSGTGLSTEAVLALGPNRSLHLVRAGAELHLVGVAEHGVMPIRTYSEAEARAAGLISEARPPTAGDLSAKPRPTTIGDLLDRLRERTVRR